MFLELELRDCFMNIQFNFIVVVLFILLLFLWLQFGLCPQPLAGVEKNERWNKCIEIPKRFLFLHLNTYMNFCKQICKGYVWAI